MLLYLLLERHIDKGYRIITVHGSHQPKKMQMQRITMQVQIYLARRNQVIKPSVTLLNHLNQ